MNGSSAMPASPWNAARSLVSAPTRIPAALASVTSAAASGRRTS